MPAASANLKQNYSFSNKKKEFAAFTCKWDIQEVIRTPSPRTACRGTPDLH